MPEAIASGAAGGRPAADEVVAREGFDNCDLTLRRKASRGGAYFEVEVHMKLHFLFRAGTAGDWAGADRTRFVQGYRTVVRRYWSLDQIGRSSQDDRITMVPTFEARIDGMWPFDHWEVLVFNNVEGWWSIDPRTGKPSYGRVNDEVRYALGPENRRNRVFLAARSNEALSLAPGATTYPSVHEYAHMLGLGYRSAGNRDEYPEGADYAWDTRSVLNYGTTVRSRHTYEVCHWAQERIAEYHSRQAMIRRLGGH